MFKRFIVVACMFWAWSAERPAHAACTPDPDSDGYCLGFPRDCNNTSGGGAINPNAQEVIGNAVDEDCDGHDALDRKFIATGFPVFAWPGTGTVTRLVNGDVTLGNGTNGGSISRTLSQTIGFGKVFIVVDVNSFSAGFGQKCEVSVTTGAYPFGTPTTTATFNIFSSGTKVSSALSVGNAARILTDITMNCDAGRTMTVDWISVQNTADVFPPTTDFSITWDDVDAPAGGLNTTIVRSSAYETVYAASDLGGVARWGPTDDTWVTINGEGSTGLTTQADLGVWDVLRLSGDLFALTGRTFSDTASWNELALSGGLWVSPDDGDTWSRIAESHGADGTSYQVGGYGRYSGCTDSSGTPTKSYGGGRLLEQDPTNIDLVYIANGDEDELGVALYDGTDVCELPVSGTTLPGNQSGSSSPTDPGYVRALARVDSATTGLPVLLVGYLGRGGSANSLFACLLPLDGEDVDITCDVSSPTAECVAVGDALGLDIRDLEVDPLDSSRVYLSDGGRITGSSSCTAGEGGVYTFQVDDDGIDIEITNWGEVPQDFDDLTGSQETEVTGLTVDPDGDYLFAFVPVTPDAIYEYDRMYRIEVADLLAGASASDWTPINTGDDDGGTTATDEAARETGIYNADPEVGWLYADTVARPERYPARWAPGQSIDGTWLDVPGDLDFAILASTFNLWGVYGLDDDCDPTCADSSTTWTPEEDTTWYVGPPADPAEPLTFQETVVRDIAEDPEGNIWIPVMDLGLFMLPEGGVAAERDCLWDSLNAGGAAVSVGVDGSVWVAFFDQDNTSDNPQELGIFRTLDDDATLSYGNNWEYQGAGTEDGQTRDGANDFRCEDNVSTYEATPFGSSSGLVFNDESADDADPSWGSPIHLAAVNETAAIAGFQSWATGTDSANGKLAITLTGGETWVDVPFDGDWDSDGADSDDCTAAEFFDLPKSISLVKPGVNTVAEDADSDGIESGEWAMDFFVGSRSGSDASTCKADHCALARVELSGDPAAPSATWTWFELSRMSSPTCTSTSVTGCAVDDGNILGVAVSPWSEEAWVYGAFTHNRDLTTPADLYYGGICSLDIDDPTSATQFVDPATHMYNIGEVAPNPWVSDLVLVVPLLDAAAWFECTELDSVGTYESLDCPDVPAPFLLDGRTGTWEETGFVDLPPSLVGTAGAWTNLSRHQILYGTEGAGAWRGTLSW